MTTPEQMDPIVVDAMQDTESQEVRVDPRFSFYDDDFPLDTKVTSDDPGNPMRKPNLTVADYTRLVLGVESRQWARSQTLHGADELDGRPFPYKIRKPGEGRSVPGKSGERRLTVADMERLTYALFTKGKVTGPQYQNAMEALRGLARVQGVLPRRRRLSKTTVSKISELTHECEKCQLGFSTAKGLSMHVVHAHGQGGNARRRQERRVAPKAPARRLGSIPKEGGAAPSFEIVFREAPKP